MDLLRSWGIAAAILLGLNTVLVFTVGSQYIILSLLPLILSGAGASLYHAEHGVGGWGRHLVAVLGVPTVLNLLLVMLGGLPRSVEEWAQLPITAAVGAFFGAGGMGLVMLVRWLRMRGS